MYLLFARKQSYTSSRERTERQELNFTGKPDAFLPQSH